MAHQDLANILGIVVNLVEVDRTLDQDIIEVRDFKVAASKLIAKLSVSPPMRDIRDVMPNTIAAAPNTMDAAPKP